MASAPKTPLGELARGAAWLLGIAVGLRVVGAVLGKSALADALFGAVFVDIATSRAGVVWQRSAPADPAARRRELTRSMGMGAGAVTAAVLVTVVIGVAAGWAHVHGGKVTLDLALSLVRACALSVRDELLLRGLPLTVAARAGVPLPAALVFAALTSTAAISASVGTTAAALAVAFASGLLFAALWVRFDSAWPALTAHATWLLLSGPLLRGGLLDISWSQGVLAAGSRANGPAAWIVAIGFLAAAAFVLRRRLAAPTEPPPASRPRRKAPTPPEAA